MPLMPEQVDDFVNLTIKKFVTGKWTDLSLEYPEYVSSTLFDEKKVVYDASHKINFKIQTRNTGNARLSGLFDVDTVNVDDVTSEGEVGWSSDVTSWAYDINESIFQTDRETIISQLLMREHAAKNDLVELREQKFWNAPTSTSDKSPLGVPYWLVKDATTTVDGAFNGGNPSGHSAGAAGIDSTTVSRWRNWTFGYTNVTTDDMVRKIKKAMFNTNFIAPVPHPELGLGKTDKCIYTTYRVREPLERLAESRNDNLGKDVARYIDAVTIGGVPVKAVPYLESNDTSDPLYGIDWKYFRPYVKRGLNMKRTGPKQAPKQRNVREVFLDTWYQIVCVDRRRMWVGSKS